MAKWNELFVNGKFIAALPQPEVYRFIKRLEEAFPGIHLSIWDLCCGAGRHTVLVSKMGYNIYGSDISEDEIAYTGKRLEKKGLKAVLKVADMVDNPFPGVNFHGAFSWDALHHNTIGNIRKAVNNVYHSLTSGGMFMLSLMSVKAGGCGRGEEIEENTFITSEGPEAWIPHHYFDESEIMELFKEWEMVELVEQASDYVKADENYDDYNPYPYIRWNITVKK